MRESPWTYKRWIAAAGYLVLVAILMVLLSRLAVYFKTGAENYGSWYQESFSGHTPSIQWLETELSRGEPMDTFQRLSIGKAYTEAWHAANLCLQTGITEGLKEYYADSLALALELSARGEEFTTERVDLSHHLKPSLFSYDQQLFAFRDSAVEIQTLITDAEGNKVFQGRTLEDFQVIMTLDDGRWRIRHMHRTAVGPKTSAPDPSKKITGKLTPESFILDGLPFHVRGINYYPAHTPWLKFWTEFSVDTLQKDLERIGSSGFNTIRIFIPFGPFGEGRVDPGMLQKLGILLDAAEEAGLKVMPSLFDFPGGYSLSDYPAADRQLESILELYGGHPAILAWDLKNEPDRDFGIHGKDNVLAWLSFILERARHYAPEQLFTIGWSTDKPADLMADQLDLVSFHYYENPGELDARINSLRERIGNKLLMLQETGMSTFNSPFFPGGRSERDQAAYLNEVLEILIDQGDLPFALWTLFDFTEAPAEVFGWKAWQRFPQKKYGLYSSDGKAKQALSILLDDQTKKTKYERWRPFDRPFYFTVLLSLLALFSGVYFLLSRRRSA